MAAPGNSAAAYHREATTPTGHFAHQEQSRGDTADLLCPAGNGTLRFPIHYGTDVMIMLVIASKKLTPDPIFF